MADILAWLVILMVVGCLIVGLIGLLMPLILSCLGFGIAILVLYIVAWLFGRLFR